MFDKIKKSIYPIIYYLHKSISKEANGTQSQVEVWLHPDKHMGGYRNVLILIGNFTACTWLPVQIDTTHYQMDNLLFR